MAPLSAGEAEMAPLSASAGEAEMAPLSDSAGEAEMAPLSDSAGEAEMAPLSDSVSWRQKVVDPALLCECDDTIQRSLLRGRYTQYLSTVLFNVAMITT